MSIFKSSLRLVLSRIKRFVFRLDLQDIYRFGGDSPASSNALMSHSVSLLRAGTLKASKDKDDTAIRFKMFDTLDVLEIIDQINPMSPYDRQFAQNRLKVGDKAIIGYHEDIPVFYGWVMFEEIELTFEVFKPTEPGMAYAYNLFTAPPFRRQGIMGKFYHFTANYLQDLEYHSLYCGISSGNTPSIKAHEKNDFHKSGFFYTVKFFGVCFTASSCKFSPRLLIHWSV